MLVDGVFFHGAMSDSYLCSAHDARLCSTQDARGCSWMGCSPIGPCAIPTCAAHRMLLDGVLSHGPMSDSYLCSTQDARGC